MPSAAPTLSRRPHRACAACGAHEATVCHHQNFVVPEGYPLPDGYDVLICLRCGFAYADPHATQQDYDRFYSDWSKYDDVASTGGGLSRYDSERLMVAASDLSRALPLDATILDAGCARGGLLEALRTAGFTSVAGLDPSPRCADACRERGFTAYVGSVQSAPADMPKFDCIVLSHVLEHVFDIPAFFAAAKRLLVRGGHLYLETPDASRYSRYLSAPFQEFNTEHINHFSARALKNTARRFGFSSVLVEQKVLQTSADMQYPAVFGIFRDLGIASTESDVIADLDLPRQLAGYICDSEAMMKGIDQHLATELRAQKTVTLWGAGQLAMKLLALPCLARPVAVRAIVDSNPVLRGKRLRGSPVVAPDEIAGTQEPIVIATLLHAKAIAAQIRQLGLKNRIVSLLHPSSDAQEHRG
jgi:2-polyprenyl-3-methyl-5-hydroxy-6-metoxy-1,4-benzoquinol methylase